MNAVMTRSTSGRLSLLSKVWIQRDGTKVGIVNKLLDLGVPRKEIGLGRFRRSCASIRILPWREY